MANTIKLKTGSGSDPSASDLIVGEIAIRTDSGKLFTKKDNGSVAEISGGGGIDDGDKGDITVSNGGDTFTIDNGVVSTAKIADDAVNHTKLANPAVNTVALFDDAVTTAKILDGNVTSAKIADGTIVNADINASAAIAGSKISPAFTGDITGTGDLTLTSTDASNSASPIIELYRNSASPADGDYLGQLKFTGENDNGGKAVYAKMTGKIDDASQTTTDGLLEFAIRKNGSNNIGARLTNTDLKLINGTGLEVAGNISCDGTVDGRDLATDGTKLDGIESNATADQTASDIKTLFNSSGLVNAQIDASAAIAGTKISPNFGSQTITTTGNLVNTKSIQALGHAAIAGTPHTYFYGRGTEAGGVSVYSAESALELVSSENSTHGSSLLLRTVTDGAGFVYNATDNALELKLFTPSSNNFSIHGTGSNLSSLDTQLRVIKDNQVELYFNGNKKFETTSSGGTLTGNLAVTGTVDGRDVATDGSKLDGIESGATADQSNSEIKTAYEANSNTNAFTDALLSKLNGIEASATADQTASEILSLLSDQNISTTGTFASDNITVTGATPKVTFTDNDANPDYEIRNHSGYFAIRDATNDANKIRVNPDGHIDIFPNLDCEAGIDVTGNITVTGTVDGVDIAARNTLFGGLTASSGVLKNGVTGTTQSAGDNSTKIATTAYTDTAISNLINGAPAALDTLNELAAAMNDDAAFSTTVTNSLATKMPLAGGQFTGNITFSGSQTVDGRDLSVDGSKLDGIESGATADQTNSEIKTAYEANSNTNAFTDALLSKLNGIAASATNVTNNNQLTNGAGYITATLTNEQVQDIVGGMVSSNTESGITVTYQDGDGTLDFAVASQTDNNFTNADHSKLDGIESGATADQTASEIRALVESASDSNVFTDADHSKLNGIASGATNVTNTNQLTNGAGFITATLTNEQVQDIVGGMVTGNTESGITVTYQDSDGTLDFTVGTLNQNTTGNAATATKLATARTIAGVSFDGSANISLNNNAITNGAGYITSADGGNAATLDGIDSTSFVRSDANDTLSGNITLSSTSADCLNFSANSTNDNRGIAINDRTALSADYNDGYLRINNQSEFSNGVYTPTVMRADGGFSVGSVQVINTSGVVLAGRVQTLNQDTTGNAATATTLETARTIAGVSFDGSANISLNNNAITNGAGYLTAVNTGNITNNAVDFSKLQDIAQNRIIGRVASGSGDATTLTAANVRSMINVEDGANNITNNNQLTNGAGYITSASFSDIAGGGTFTGAITAPRISGSNGIVEMKQEIGTSQTLTTGYNAIAVDPTVASGVTITVPSGAVWAIV